MNETRVRYVGPHRSGVPEGRMGTLLEPIEDGIAMVKWDPYENTDCQVTHSGAAASDLEVVTSIPQCELPTRPGVYLMAKPKGYAQVAVITRQDSGLYITYSISYHSLDTLSKDTKFWGPIEAK